MPRSPRTDRLDRLDCTARTLSKPGVMAPADALAKLEAVAAEWEERAAMLREEARGLRSARATARRTASRRARARAREAERLSAAVAAAREAEAALWKEKLAKAEAASAEKLEAAVKLDAALAAREREARMWEERAVKAESEEAKKIARLEAIHLAARDRDASNWRRIVVRLQARQTEELKATIRRAHGIDAGKRDVQMRDAGAIDAEFDEMNEIARLEVAHLTGRNRDTSDWREIVARLRAKHAEELNLAAGMAREVDARWRQRHAEELAAAVRAARQDEARSWEKERAGLLAANAHLEARIAEALQTPEVPLGPEALPVALRLAEKRVLLAALNKTGGNRGAAARLLGISRFGLQKRAERCGIGPARSRPPARRREGWSDRPDPPQPTPLAPAGSVESVPGGGIAVRE